MSNTIAPYPKIYALGHSDIPDILATPVVVQEKFDGSQISFGINDDGRLMVKSKSVMLDVEANSNKMFAPAVDYLLSVRHYMQPGIVYRGECLTKPKHNVLQYGRVPAGYVVLYDVSIGGMGYANPLETPWAPGADASLLGLEHAEPLLIGQLDRGRFDALLERTSMLGGALIEGVVIKNYTQQARYGGPSFAKYVSEAFKETHRQEWKGRDMTRADVLQTLIDEHATPARYAKAVQHLREQGQLAGSPRDIGALMAEATRDIEAECAADIKERLYQHFRRDILRGATKNLPQWYKDQLAAKAFEANVGPTPTWNEMDNPADVAAYHGETVGDGATTADWMDYMRNAPGR